ncbi:hypothetical protein C7N43_04450 [Sphingobacteriales bacterium UPWRP_1]|nr:hypothetical protein B6N25_04985 [Sphingobacteriales bacterium TSM_CSS]PSJ78315.1 hypothetical protein C7N43_04450 [Sphingobacteriales bacterium UPWRP_1]
MGSSVVKFTLLPHSCSYFCFTNKNIGILAVKLNRHLYQKPSGMCKNTLKILLTAIMLLLYKPVFTQSVADCSLLSAGTYQLCDNFSDADFTANPAWNGDTGDFTTDAQQLRSNATTASPVQLITPVVLNMAGNDIQWEFLAQLKFNTSSNNYTDVFLASNTDNLKADVSGYFVRIGGTPDEVSLWRKDGTTPVLLVDGVDGITASTNNLLRIKVLRTAAGEWTLLRDLGLTGSYFTEGTATDATYTAGTQFGILLNYTSSNSGNFYFDDFYIGTPIIDTTVPVVTNVFAPSGTTVVVQFSEPLNAASAQNAGNYLLNGTVNPVSATLTSGTTITLAFAAPFTSGQTNTLQISGVQDAAGNTMLSANFNFTWYIPQPADVLMNEIFADPTPVVGLPDAEFIELYNNTGYAINLNGWGFTKTYPAIEYTLPPATLAPNGYLIVCATANAPLYEPFGQTLGILSSATYLTNSGSNLTLLSPDGTVIDQVNYSDDWYQNTQKAEGGWSLERIDPQNPCNSANNWIASINPNGGTPAAQNSVTGVITDTTPPQISGYSLINANAIEISFTEPLTGSALGNPGNYQFNAGSGLSVVSVIEEAQTLTLLLNANMLEGVIYTISIGEVQDCSGNVAEGLQIQAGIAQPANAYDVLMTEIFADTEPPAQYPNPNLTLPKVRFVELYNRSNKIIDLAGWQFRDATDTAYLSSYLLLPQTYMVLCSSTQTAELAALGIAVLGVTGFPALNTTGDNLLLVNAAGTYVHAVNYQKSWYADAIKAEGGYTLEMIDPNNPCEEARNWRASNADAGGTPGAQNSVYASNPDVTLPDLLRAEAINPTTVVLFFTETLNRQAASDVAQYSISNGVGNPLSATVPLTNFKTVVLTLAAPIADNTIYTVSVGQQVTDCAGNAVGQLYSQAPFGIAHAAQPNDMVINEILFNPATGGYDYVELYNRTNTVLSLNGWYTANTEPETADTLVNHELMVTEVFSLHPGAYVVLTENVADIILRYGQCGATLNPARFIQTGLPTLDDTEGTIAITDLFNTTVIDRVDYLDDWHNEILDNKDGVSLERINPDAASDSPDNWQSAASTACYGTPSLPNSQSAVPGIGTETFTVLPQAFSPDGDGNDDFTLISYQLPNPGYIANITIYDERGREVRRLVQNELLGTQGFYKWDGITSNSPAEKASLGIYILYIELFNLSGDVQKIKKTCVVGGKLN